MVACTSRARKVTTSTANQADIDDLQEIQNIKRELGSSIHGMRCRLTFSEGRVRSNFVLFGFGVDAGQVVRRTVKNPEHAD